VSQSLRVVIDALARAGVLIEAPPADVGGLEITGLTADARRLQRGMLFCAVRGAVLDGHQFVKDAAARGAAAALERRGKRSRFRRSSCATAGGRRRSPRKPGTAGRHSGCSSSALPARTARRRR
jgi:hypothetical protein